MARELSDNLASLAKKLDQKVIDHKDKKLAFVIVLMADDKETSEKALAEFEEDHTLRNTALAFHSGVPKNYKIDDDAEITLMMWVKKTVKANHAFANAAALNGRAVTTVVDDTKSILE